MAFTEDFEFWFLDTPRHGELDTGNFDYWLADTPFVQPTPPFNVFQGWAQNLLVQREATPGGMVSGTPYVVMARTAFNYEPVQVNGVNRVNLWRSPDGATTAGRFHRGSIEAELNFGNALLLLLETLFETTSVTPTGFGDSVHALYPNRGRPRRTVKLQLTLDNGKHQVWHNVVVESVTFTVAARRLVKVRLEWKSASFDPKLDAPVIDILSAATEENDRCTGNSFVLRVDGGDARPDVQEFALRYDDRIEAQRFDTLGVPAVLAPSGPTAWSVDMSVWWARDDSFDLWAELTRSMRETRLLFSVESVVAGKTKVLLLDTGRWVFRSGTPVPMSRESQPFRVSAQKQTADARPGSEELKITI